MKNLPTTNVQEVFNVVHDKLINAAQNGDDLTVVDSILFDGIDWNGEIQLIVDDDSIEINYSIGEEVDFRDPIFFDNTIDAINKFVEEILLLSVA